MDDFWIILHHIYIKKMVLLKIAINVDYDKL